MDEINEKRIAVLKKLGMTKEEIEHAYEVNKNLQRVLDIDIKQVIVFLYKNYGLESEEICRIAVSNPWILTESFERMRYLEESYKGVGIENIGELLIKMPIALSLNPKVLDEFIENLKKENKTNEEIKEVILNTLDEYFGV